MNYQSTSAEAWRAFLPISAVLDRQIMTALERAGLGGLTCQEIEAAIGREHQAVSGNLRHLVEKGLVKSTGIFGLTRSGRRAIKWAVIQRAATDKAARTPQAQGVLL